MGNAAGAVPPPSPLFAPIEAAQSSVNGKHFKDTGKHTVLRLEPFSGHKPQHFKDTGKRSQVEQRRKQQAAARATATFSSSSEDDDASISCAAQLRRAMEVTASLQERARWMEQQVTACNRRCRLC
jgi:hypothetical protein